MLKKHRVSFAAAAAVAGIVGLSPTVVSAGEVTGNGRHLDMHSRSECAFSGLEDWASSTPQPEGGILVKPGVTQNWGQIPQADRAFLRTIGLSPGDACNGHKAPRR